MAVRNDGQAKAFEYMQLLQSGVSPADAYKKVYPNGIPTAAQQQQQAAKDRQSSALAGTGGTIAGLLGMKYGMKGLESLMADKAKEEIVKQGTQEAVSQGAQQVVGQEVTNQGRNS